MLILADVHLGKVTHFRKSGVALPIAVISDQLDKLKALIQSLTPHQVVFLGDLFHSDLNSEWELFQKKILNQHSCKFTLVKGNHDILPTSQYEMAGLEILEKIETDGITLVHEPGEKTTNFEVCGHIHPGFVFKGKGKQSVRLPCLYKADKTAVLPAYGDFTGLQNIHPLPGDEVYLITKNRILPLNF